MRAPPAAGWPVTDDLRWRAAQALLWALAAGGLGAWFGQQAHDRELASLLAAALGALTGAAVGWSAGAQRGGEIVWTGSQWRWRPRPVRAARAARAARVVRPALGAVPAADPAGQAITPPEVMLDLQGWMLLRWRAAGGGPAQWRSVHGGATPDAAAADAALRWTTFRAAVYCAASRNDGFSGPESRLP